MSITNIFGQELSDEDFDQISRRAGIIFLGMEVAVEEDRDNADVFIEDSLVLVTDYLTGTHLLSDSTALGLAGALMTGFLKFLEADK